MNQRVFARDLLTYMPSKLLPALTGFISAPILTRLFLPAEYGEYALAAGVADFLFALACSGLASSPVRFYPAYKARSEVGVFFANLGGTIGLSIVVVGALSLAALLSLRPLVTVTLYPLLLLGLAVFATDGLFNMFHSVARAQGRSGVYTAFELVTRYGSLGIGLLLVLAFGFRVDGLLWGTVVTSAFALPFLARTVMRGEGVSRSDFRGSDARQLWDYGWPLAVGNMALWGLRLSDRYVIGLSRPGDEVGLYSVAYNLSDKTILMLVSLFLLSTAPLITTVWESEGREATERGLAMVTRFYLIVCFPAAAGLTVLAYPFVGLLTGDAYHDGYRVVGFVAFSSFCWGLSQMAGLGTLLGKRTSRVAISQSVASALNLGLNLILVPTFGFVAAGATTLVGYAVLLGMQAYFSRSYLTWRFPFPTARNVVIASVVMSVVAWAVYRLAGAGSLHLGYLLLAVLVAVPTYFASLALLGEASAGELATIRRAWAAVGVWRRV
jgi:O-antigen/teichoic acid export membrane protein